MSTDTKTTVLDTYPRLRDLSHRFFIGGQWVTPVRYSQDIEVINPATESPIATIRLGSAQDVDAAVSSAAEAFVSFSRSTIEERKSLLRNIASVYAKRSVELAEITTAEMGAPTDLATSSHVPAGINHFQSALKTLDSFSFETEIGSTRVIHEPIGVCAFITPWNWPLNQITAKVAYALAAGCTMVLKPSELAPLNALAFADVLAEAGTPAGVFNLVNGDGPIVGKALAEHPQVEMVSFTGSTRAGVQVAIASAPTVKRVTQELGGKSANIILDDARFPEAVAASVRAMYSNSGQSCNAGTRMLVPASRMEEAIAIAQQESQRIRVGDPEDPATDVGPVVSKSQFDRVQSLIQTGIAEGARLVVGGLGKPEGLASGYYVRPTVFADVTNSMTISREEIFGPVLAILGYEDDDEAVQIANDSPYGLSGMVWSENVNRAKHIARRLRTGMVHLNGAFLNTDAPFGGYKKSGNGREFGEHGLKEFLEVKSIFGHSHE